VWRTLRRHTGGASFFVVAGYALLRSFNLPAAVGGGFVPALFAKKPPPHTNTNPHIIPVTIKIEDNSPTRKTAVVTVPAATIAGYKKDILKEYTREVRLPGFRPGKAPVALIQQRFNDSILGELASKVTHEAVEKFMEETKPESCTLVDVDGLKEISADADATLTLTFDVVPEFELPSYKNLELGVAVEPVEDGEITARIDTIRSQRARFEPVERAAAKGDYVKIAYTGTVEGKLVSEIAPDAHLYGTQKATWEQAGAEGEHFGIPEIVAGLVGLKTGDKARFAHEFPADFKVEQLRGKTADYDVEVSEVRAKIMPELDAEFFAAAGVKDADELRERVTAVLQREKENVADDTRRAKALSLLLAASNIVVPPATVDAAAERLFRDRAQTRLQEGADVAEIERERAEFIKKVQPQALEQVQTRLLLEKIARVEKLELNRDALAQRLTYEAYARREEPRKYVNEIIKDRELLAAYQRDTLVSQALAFVVENAKP
jgi:trigger factor